jgi:hypothetical protein
VKIDFNDKFIAVNKKGEVGCAAIKGSKKHPPMTALRMPTALPRWQENI